MEAEPNEFNVLHQYLAQIAYQIVRVNAKDPEKVDPDAFVLKFEKRAKEDPKPPPERQRQAHQSKALWQAVLKARGIKFIYHEAPE